MDDVERDRALPDELALPEELARELAQALAQERERIGRDLHDTVIQDLYGIGLMLESTLGLIEEPQAARRVRTAVHALDDSIRRLRSVIFMVSEPDPAAPVAELISRVVAGRVDQLGFTPDVVVPDAQARLPPAMTAELLQFVSEALANVARHAGATRAQVRLDLGPGAGWSLTVCDDGGGFDPETVPAGFGLGTLRRRAQLLAARLELESVPGG